MQAKGSLIGVHASQINFTKTLSNLQSALIIYFIIISLSSINHRMQSEKNASLSVDSSCFMNSLYYSQSFSKFYSSQSCQAPVALRSNSSRIYCEQLHSLINLFNFSLYFCLYSSSLLGLAAFKLIDKNLSALSFDPSVGYFGLRYPNCAKHLIMILLR